MTTPIDRESVEQALAELEDMVRCRCHEAYRGRGLHDPDCQCDSAEAVATVRAALDAAEAERDALAEKLERAVGALRIALDDLDEWCGCADSLTKAGFNIDDTAERTELCRATLAQITGETDGNL